MKVIQKAFGSYYLENADPSTLGSTGFGLRIPAGDLLGLRDEQPYYMWLERRWGKHASRRRAKRWIQDGTADELVRLARAAMQGLVPYAGLDPFLRGIRYGPVASSFTCKDFATLAAWSLKRSAESGALTVECPSCHRPHFVSRGSSPYCRRPAPGLSTTCAQSYAHEAFSERRREWNKEYRRVHARKQRGTVSEEDWQRWRADPFGSAQAPDLYIPFDGWIELEPDKGTITNWVGSPYAKAWASTAEGKAWISAAAESEGERVARILAMAQQQSVTTKEEEGNA